MSTYLRLLLIGGSIVSMSFISAIVSAQPFEQLGVKEAIAFTLRQHSELELLTYQLEEAKQKQTLSYSLPDPIVSYAREGIAEDGNPAFNEQRWVVSQSIPNPVASYYSYQASGENVKQLEYKIESLKWELRTNVKTAYANLAYRTELLKLSNTAVTMSERVLNAVNMRLESGLATNIDLLKAELQVQSARNKRELAIQQFHEARYNLFKQMGLNPEDQTYMTQFTDSLVYFNSSIDQNELLNRLDQQPIVQSQNRVIKKFEYQTDGRQAQYLPDIEVQYFQQDFGNGFDFNGFQAGISVPLWFFGNQMPQVEIAKLQTKKAVEQRRQLLINLKERNEIAWHGYQSALNIIRRYQNQQSQYNEELLMLTRKAYENGQIALLNLLDTQRSYLTYQQDYLDALVSYYQKVIQLERFIQTDIAFKDQLDSE